MKAKCTNWDFLNESVFSGIHADVWVCDWMSLRNQMKWRFSSDFEFIWIINSTTTTLCGAGGGGVFRVVFIHRELCFLRYTSSFSIPEGNLLCFRVFLRLLSFSVSFTEEEKNQFKARCESRLQFEFYRAMLVEELCFGFCQLAALGCDWQKVIGWKNGNHTGRRQKQPPGESDKDPRLQRFLKMSSDLGSVILGKTFCWRCADIKELFSVSDRIHVWTHNVRTAPITVFFSYLCIFVTSYYIFTYIEYANISKHRKHCWMRFLLLWEKSCLLHSYWLRITLAATAAIKP